MTSSDVRARLVNAAEALFAERGSESVSLREITTAAGASNASAIQYHFGGREGLVRAVMAKHHPAVEARRHALLDQYEAAADEDLRTLTAAYVRPLAAELGDPLGGPGYLQLYADLLNRPQPAIDPGVLEDHRDSTTRWRTLVAPRIDPAAVRLHRRFAVIRFTVSELARRGHMARKREHDRFTSDLIDQATALLAAPVSDETRRLSPKRRAASS